MKNLIIAICLAFAPFASFAQTKDVVDIAISSADHTTLVAAVKAANLVETLNSAGPFTVFAPTNVAFEALPQAVFDYLTANPDFLIATLSYHIVSTEIMIADVG